MNNTVAPGSYAPTGYRPGSDTADTENRPISPIEDDRVAAAAAAHNALARGAPLLVIAGGLPEARTTLARALTIERLASGDDVLVLVPAHAGHPWRAVVGHLGLPDSASDVALADAIGTYVTAEIRLVVLLPQAERLGEDGLAGIRRLRLADPAAQVLSMVLIGDDTAGLIADRLMRPPPPGGLRFIRLAPLGLDAPATVRPPPVRGVAAASPLPTPSRADLTNELPAEAARPKPATIEPVPIGPAAAMAPTPMPPPPVASRLITPIPSAAEPAASVPAGATAEPAWADRAVSPGGTHAEPAVRVPVPPEPIAERPFPAPAADPPVDNETASAVSYRDRPTAADESAKEYPADEHPAVVHPAGSAWAHLSEESPTDEYQTTHYDPEPGEADRDGAVDYQDAFAQLAAKDATADAPRPGPMAMLHRSQVIGSIEAEPASDLSAQAARRRPRVLLPLVGAAAAAALVGWFAVSALTGMSGSNQGSPPGALTALSPPPPSVPPAPGSPPAAGSTDTAAAPPPPGSAGEAQPTPATTAESEAPHPARPGITPDSPPEAAATQKLPAAPAPQSPVPPAPAPPPPMHQAMVQPAVPPSSPVPGSAPSRPASPGLLVIAKADDTLRSLYSRVYKGLPAPPFDVVAAMNPHEIRLGDVVVFPAPPGGWKRPPNTAGR